MQPVFSESIGASDVRSGDVEGLPEVLSFSKTRKVCVSHIHHFRRYFVQSTYASENSDPIQRVDNI